MKVIVRKTGGGTEAIEVHPPMVNAATRALFARARLDANGELVFPLNAEVTLDRRTSADQKLPTISGAVTLAKIEQAAAAVIQAEAQAQASREAFADRLLARGVVPQDGTIAKDGTVSVRDEQGRVFRFERGHAVATAIEDIHRDPFKREREAKEADDRERVEGERAVEGEAPAEPLGGGGR